MTEGPSLNHEAVMAALEGVRDPELHASITKLGMVKDVSIDGGAVALSIELTTPACPLKDQIGTDIEAALEGIGAKDIEISWGAEVQASTPREGQKPVRGVRNIIAIASNKGGVGKSTVAANLAISLSVEGARVGLLDADITGPNIPTMFGLPAGLQSTSAEGLQGIDRYGVKVISIGFLLPRGTPVVWRGPMVGSAVRQLLHDVTWGELDYLVIDLPPGTGDASMSMAQEAPITGTVIVSTPQIASIEDAMKAISMFEKLGVPVFGMVENMSYFIAPDTGTRYDIFGHGGARAAAEELGIDFLGEIPIEPAIGDGAERGAPISYSAPDSASAREFRRLAGVVASRISVLQRMGG